MPDVQQLMGEARRALAAPSRTPRTAVVVGRLLAIAFLLCFGTGLFSHYLQDPLPWMRFPTRPTFLYQWTQGIHITAGILCFPLLFAKLYAVFPELFQTPAIRSFPHFLERASIALFVAASLVQIVTGMLNTYQWYALFPFPFRQTHYALSFVIIGSLAIHIALKLPIISAHWTKRASATTVSAETGDAVSPAAASPAAAGVTGRIFAWIDRTPAAPPRASRRAFLTTVGVASAALVVTTAGQSFRVLDPTNIFAPRKAGIGPNGLPVNRTAAAAKVTETAVAPDWTLTVTNGETSRSFSRAALAALPQHQVDLPIACVEGWSQTASWRGPRLSDLLDTVGADTDARIRLTSLEQKSSYAVTEMGPEYARDALTLVALELAGQPLDIDHGYPARMIAPGRPGVMQTKWLSTLEVI
ncbi:cytochrome b561-like protein [Glaciihabitans tibetensis]|uniref:Cytochrome b561-like protein n=1 Tax=Glaciihabitans tibetensis TaxID=1266600 RepID=A0A2T0VAS4_9MICO|nr:molybdopterin-dependent oxidoreductase [Glaciihabitans tibetensis]PRY67300.1 cytochrome b561-like protein [Glaciihabitans tibetensis]